MTSNAEIGGFIDFLAISGCETHLRANAPK